MLLESVYIIRDGTLGAGPFANSFLIKIILIIATVIIIFYDWHTKERLDYFWIFLIGSLFWMAVEAVMQLTGERTYRANLLFGFALPLYISIPIQAMAECGSILIIALFFADRMLEEETKKKAAVGYAALMALLFISAFFEGIQTPNYGGDVLSRRKMFTIDALIFLSIFSAITFVFLFVKPVPEHRMRGIYMLVLMAIFGAVWNFGEFLAGTRWIEVGTEGNTRHAHPLIEFGAFAFDSIVEIAVIYVMFLAIPIWLRLIKSE